MSEGERNQEERRCKVLFVNIQVNSEASFFHVQVEGKAKVPGKQAVVPPATKAPPKKAPTFQAAFASQEVETSSGEEG